MLQTVVGLVSGGWVLRHMLHSHSNYSPSHIDVLNILISKLIEAFKGYQQTNGFKPNDCPSLIRPNGLRQCYVLASRYIVPDSFHQAEVQANGETLCII